MEKLENIEELFSSEERLLIDEIQQKIYLKEPLPHDKVEKLVTLVYALKESVNNYADALFNEPLEITKDTL